MENIAGSPVRGENFFDRENLLRDAWNLLGKGQHILIAAPRRVGKTSLMYYLMDHSKPGYTFLYFITESVNDENEFFRRMVNKVVKTDIVRRSQKIQTFLKTKLPTITKIGPEGVEFGPKDIHEYQSVLIDLFNSMQSELGKLIIMVDEFPETLENIKRDQGEKSAIHFLQSNRELRQDLETIKSILFIYTGSIGLENIVQRLNAVKTIADLTYLKIPPLKEDEAKRLFKCLMEKSDFTLDESIMEYTINKIEWLIPFHIQLIFEEIGKIIHEQMMIPITEKVVDQAFNSMLEKRIHFEHCHTRLRASLKSDEYNFSKELLNVASESGIIHANEIFDFAVKHHLETDFKDLVGSLVYDGYINNQDDRDTYRFNSPVIRMWWRQNVAN
jgi:AAA+ ATPase superfamily predicted ATPase